MCCLMKDEGGRMDVVSTSLHNKSLRQAPVPIRGSDDQPILKNTPSSQHDFEIRLIWRTTTTSSKSLLLPLNFSVPKSFNYITKHLRKLRYEGKVAFPPVLQPPSLNLKRKSQATRQAIFFLSGRAEGEAWRHE